MNSIGKDINTGVFILRTVDLTVWLYSTKSDMFEAWTPQEVNVSNIIAHVPLFNTRHFFYISSYTYIGVNLHESFRFSGIGIPEFFDSRTYEL